MKKNVLICFLITGMLFAGFAYAGEERIPAIDHIWSWITAKAKIVWEHIYTFLNKEVEQRKPGAEEEFKKETEELKQEIREKGPSFWQRLKDLVQ